MGDTPIEAAGPTVKNGKIVLPADDMGSGETLQGVFYFDFDQAIVRRSGHEELNKHAKVLSADSGLRVRLEGHADERGTREYNLALGERRANAVRAYLVAQGAARMPRSKSLATVKKSQPITGTQNQHGQKIAVLRLFIDKGFDESESPAFKWCANICH